MEEEYSGIINHLTLNYQEPSKVILKKFIPLIHMKDWIKKDKKEITFPIKVFGCIGVSSCKAFKISLEIGVVYGTYLFAKMSHTL